MMGSDTDVARLVQINTREQLYNVSPVTFHLLCAMSATARPLIQHFALDKSAPSLPPFDFWCKKQCKKPKPFLWCKMKYVVDDDSERFTIPISLECEGYLVSQSSVKVVRPFNGVAVTCFFPLFHWYRSSWSTAGNAIAWTNSSVSLIYYILPVASRVTVIFCCWLVELFITSIFLLPGRM